MKTLVTGAGGFLGSRIVESLLREGVTDLRLQFRRAPSEALLASLRDRFPAARFEIAVVDLLQQSSLDPVVRGVDSIVHAAAGTRGAPAEMFANSVVATRNLLDAAVAQGVRRIVLISSFVVYRTEALPRGALVTETSELESVGLEKGPYAYAKTRQEQLYLEYQQRHGFEFVILRPGIVYGPESDEISSRIGFEVKQGFVSPGHRCTLPLTYVDNCADAITRATLHAPSGSVFNVVDDELPTAGRYLARYRREVRKLRVLRSPHWLLLWVAKKLKRGPSPYLVRSLYRPLTFSNGALKAIGWVPRVSTQDGLTATFKALKTRSARA